MELMSQEKTHVRRKNNCHGRQLIVVQFKFGGGNEVVLR